jgi:hypothetical protein
MMQKTVEHPRQEAARGPRPRPYEAFQRRMSCTGKRPATDCAEPESSARQRLSNVVPAESAPSTAAAPVDSTANSSSTGASSCDELIAAAPKLIAAMRLLGKCVKVAEKVASLLEEGRVKPSNAGAVFEVLTAAVEDPTRWRKPAMRPAFRRLFCAADARLVLFAMPQQQAMLGSVGRASVWEAAPCPSAGCVWDPGRRLRCGGCAWSRRSTCSRTSRRAPSSM